MARNMSANIAQTLAMHRAVYPLGQSTFTAAWNSMAQTSHSVRHSENLCAVGDVTCGTERSRGPFREHLIGRRDIWSHGSGKYNNKHFN